MSDSGALDLVRQYGDERQRMGSASIAGSAPTVHEHKMRAAALLTRITALVAQRPVPARHGSGGPWWQHYCGWVGAYQESKKPTRCPSCGTLSPWRPLLVEPWPGEVSA